MKAYITNRDASELPMAVILAAYKMKEIMACKTIKKKTQRETRGKRIFRTF
jgi:hypothetical protein